MTRRWLLLVCALIYALLLAIGAMIPSKPDPTGSFVGVNGHKVHFIQAGSGPDLVLLHGASSSVLDWTYGPLAKLAESYRVTAFDRPGLGHSDRIANGTDLRVQARHLIAASKALGLEKPRVMGHSFGGAVALAWAVEDQENIAGLMLMSSPSHIWPTGMPWHYRLINTPVIGPVAAWLFAAFTGEHFAQNIISRVFAPQTAPTEYAPHVLTGLAFQPSIIRANAAQLSALKDQLAALTPLYPSLNLPIESLHGNADRVVPLQIHAEALAEALPNNGFTRLDGVGHMPQHTHWEAVAQSLARLEDRLN